MRVEEIIYSILINDTTVSASIGNNVFPLRSAQNKNVPFITYTTSNTPNSNKREKSIFDTYDINIDIFSDSYSLMINMVDAIRDLFEATTFTIDNITVDFDYITTREDYKNDAELFNKTIVLIASYQKLN